MIGTLGKLTETLRSKMIPLELRRRYTVLMAPRMQGEEPSSSSNLITIARVIGNDLWPRHAEGQSTRNLEFILENEPNFPDSRKAFVINRMFDSARQQHAIDKVREHGHIPLVLPFVDEDYAKKVGDLSWLNAHDDAIDGGPARSLDYREAKKRLWASAEKIRYAININGARNAALEDGRKHGKWTVILDGSCFVSDLVFKQLQTDLCRDPVTPYVIIPMMRLQSNELALTQTPKPNRLEEPHIAFHRDSIETFDERYPYGLRDKTSLLARLGVPGAWLHWRSWEGCPQDTSDCPERYHYKFANTSVFRLSSGARGGRLEAASSNHQRNQSRNEAIFLTLAMLDRRVGCKAD